MKKYLLLFGVNLITLLSSFAQNSYKPDFISHINTPNVWADSLLATLSTREKIAQLLMVAAYSHPTSNTTASRVNEEVISLINHYQIGGVIFFQGSPQRQIDLTNHFQELSKIPLLISMDAEWGVGMRLDSVSNFPYQLAMATSHNDMLMYQIGIEVAQQFKQLGMHVNFAPVVDINSNPNNPVINVRSFGEDKHIVTRKSLAYMQGMQSEGILACAKHFPGHGNTDKDSHYEVPTLNICRKAIDSIDLFPFKSLINDGIAGVMVGHLSVPSIDNTKQLASLSSHLTDSLLHQTLNFKGLTFTDGMQMKAVTQQLKPAQANLQALLAGNDILVFPTDIPATFDTIEAAIQQGRMTMQKLDEKCLRVLRSKHWLGLSELKKTPQLANNQQLNSNSANLLLKEIADKTITLTHNPKLLIPLQRIDTLRIAYIEASKNNLNNTFYNTAKEYAQLTPFYVNQHNTVSYDTLRDRLKEYNLIIVNYMDISQRLPHKNYDMNSEFCEFIGELASRNNVILSLFSSPYTLSQIPNVESLSAIIIANQRSDNYQRSVADAILGGIGIRGKSPVSVKDRIQLGQGLSTKKTRLRSTSPEELGINPQKLVKIDSMVATAIQMQTFPGCQIVAAYKGNIFYQKSFGYHTYSNEMPVENNHLYDIASITKIVGTLPLIMKMKDEEFIDLNESLGTYISLPKKNAKRKLLISDILLHQSGLHPWLPIHVSFLHSTLPTQTLLSKQASEEYPFKLFGNSYLNKFHELDSSLFAKNISDVFPHPVAHEIYAHKSIRGKVYEIIDQSDLGKKRYQYSDLGFYYLQRIIEEQIHTPLDKLADDFFFAPLGMSHTAYLPLRKFPIKQIVPTEWEKPFRRQLIQGYVHDHGAAIMGGVAGHAGVFSTATDLAKMMQMFLWKGTYGGTQFLNAKTVDEFTKCQGCSYGSRRGYGFDKPEPNPKKKNPVPAASVESYGHSGFTGTFVWVDPKRDLVYVFLSNRIHPDYTNNLISTSNIRTNILQEFISVIDDLQKEN
ncbi:MAG: glycoside hydrolase family 3 N-terminal domain-containing protein [Bacteroidales bacterium]